MTLRLHFDDLVHKMNDMQLLDGAEKDFIECILRSMGMKEECDKTEEELKNLKKVLAEKKKEVGGLKSLLKTECSKLEEERKKNHELKEERTALATVLEDVRSVVSGHNTTKADVWSLIESANSMSLTSSQ
ncbi:hypothetical protein AVEN_65627-2 [Araneus ventricosus]|uniref:Uncharacterized protein n=1 Tax=Araneus ventricosus TaxID=182803 RepID=A0A4Y2H0G3_ARAVE|nr:hypothetical protein AVEN_65627-1 [Araneus ventricosus]GBM58937.1 hypothetical protein AVEN_65627-2 [Araneus ventricosus]